MTLWSLDEARCAVVASATVVLTEAECDIATRGYLVWGAGGMDGLSSADQVLSVGHRCVLDTLVGLGYAWVAVEELEGVCSAAGICDDDREPSVDDLPEPGERWPFAA